MFRLKWTQTWCCVFLLIIGLIFPVSPVEGNNSDTVTQESIPVVQKSKQTKQSMQKKSSGQSSPVITDSPPNISAESAVLMDVITGDVLFNKQAFKRKPPASTTKIMTAILGLELGCPDEVVTVSSKAAAVGESTIHLDPGEKIPLYELITGALVRSGNDACVAIAEHIAGSEQQFLKLMNRKAFMLGARDTHFTNTNGLPVKDHYSTAYDLALMASYGLQIPAFASITRQKETDIHFLEPDFLMNIRNTNKLLWNYPFADGVKTGTTTAAGKCLVASATKEGRQLVVVVLNAPNRFGDAKTLLEWGFLKTEIIKIAGAGEVLAEFPIKGLPAVKAYIEYPLMLSIRKSCRETMETRIIWERNQSLPVEAGEKLGRCEIWVAGQKLKTVPLLSEREVKATDYPLKFLYRRVQ